MRPVSLSSVHDKHYSCSFFIIIIFQPKIFFIPSPIQPDKHVFSAKTFDFIFVIYTTLILLPVPIHHYLFLFLTRSNLCIKRRKYKNKIEHGFGFFTFTAFYQDLLQTKVNYHLFLCFLALFFLARSCKRKQYSHLIRLKIKSTFFRFIRWFRELKL